MSDIVSAVALAAAVSLFPGGQALDLTGLADVNLELGITVTGDDAWLAKVISRASAAARGHCGRPFVPQLYLDQFFSTRQPWPAVARQGVDTLQFAQFPLLGGPSPALTAPPPAPVASSVPGGALAAALLYARIAYVTPTGETAASLETFAPIAAANFLTIASPPPDPLGLATGWNVYVGAASMSEMRQNSTPIAIGTPWTQNGALTAGPAFPAYSLLVENEIANPTPLAEGLDFLIDASRGQALRLDRSTRRPKAWRSSPLLALYNAGFAAIPDDLQDAVIDLVKSKWFARGRDPMVRSDNVVGVQEYAYWSAAAGGAEGDLPPGVVAKLARFRTPVTG